MSGNQGFPLIGPPQAALLTFPPLGFTNLCPHTASGGDIGTRAAAEVNSAAITALGL